MEKFLGKWKIIAEAVRKNGKWENVELDERGYCHVVSINDRRLTCYLEGDDPVSFQMMLEMERM